MTPLDRARSLYDSGDDEEAAEAALEALHDARGAGDPEAEVRAHVLWAELLFLCDDARARSQMEAALRLSRKVGLADIEADALEQLAEMALEDGRLEDAREALEGAASVCLACSLHVRAATALRRNGELLESIGYPRRALEALEAALAAYRRASDAAGAALCEETLEDLRRRSAGHLPLKK